MAKAKSKARVARGLSIFRRDNGSYRAQVRLTGFPQQSKDWLTFAEADEWGQTILAEYRQNGQAVDRGLSRRTTFQTAIERYIEEVTRKRPNQNSVISEESRLRRFLRVEAKLCSYALAYLTPEMFQDWSIRRAGEFVSRGQPDGRGQYRPETHRPGRFKKDGTLRANAAKPKAAAAPPKTLTASSLKREMTLLKGVLDFAKGRYKLAANPMDKEHVPRPSVSDQRDVRLEADAWERLLEECRASENPWLAPIVELAFETAARRGSLLKLRWDDLQVEKFTAVLRGVKNSRKPSEVRNAEIGLSPRAIEILRALPVSIDGRLFPTTKEAIASAFKRARRRAGLSHFRFHDVRHEAASRMVEDGWNVLDVMAQCDWRDIKSAQRYYKPRGLHLGGKLAEAAARRSAAKQSLAMSGD